MNKNSLRKRNAPIITDFPDSGSDIENNSEDESEQSDIFESDLSFSSVDSNYSASSSETEPENCCKGKKRLTKTTKLKATKKQRKTNYIDMDSSYTTPVDSKFLG